MKKALLIVTMLISVAYSSPNKLITNVAVDSVYICVSKTNHKYHDNRDCRGLARCTHEIRKVTKAQAIKVGYGACKICYN